MKSVSSYRIENDPYDVPDDEVAYALALAVDAARRGEGHTRPNPPVGAVVVLDGKAIGTGWHRRAGTDHAEVAAIKDAERKGHGPVGATLYVTLEPCSEAGRVGACTDAIIAARIARVIYAVHDPNPKNRGKAERALAKAGVVCICAADAEKRRKTKDRGANRSVERLRNEIERSRMLIAPFAKHVTTGLPYVTVKLAMSLDGRICDNRGHAKWISSPAARKVTGKVRERVDAIMVGAETIRKDDPSLVSHGRRNDDLVRVVISKSGRLPKGAQVFTDGLNPTLVFDDPVKALRELGKMGLMHVVCEGGLVLARSLVEAGMVDRWTSVLCPLVIGNAPLADAARLSLVCESRPDSANGEVIREYVFKSKPKTKPRKGANK